MILHVSDIIVLIAIILVPLVLVLVADVLVPRIGLFARHTKLVNVARLVLSGVLLIGIGGALVSNLSPIMPDGKLDEEMLAERLFVNVRQDSLQHLVDANGMKFKAANIFSNSAKIIIPAGITKFNAELESLSTSYDKKLQVKSTNDSALKLQCPTIKLDGNTYVTVPVIMMVELLQQNNAHQATTSFDDTEHK